MLLIALLAFTVVPGCDFFTADHGTPPSPTPTPYKPKTESSSGGSGNGLSVDNGVMRVAIVLLENDPVLQMAGENIPIYQEDMSVNTKALGKWFKAVQLSDADLPPENRVALETVEITVGTDVPEEAVEECVSVIRDLDIDVVTEVEGQPDKN